MADTARKPRLPLLATDNCDGVIVTHGTNTLEEMAYFLNFSVRNR